MWLVLETYPQHAYNTRGDKRGSHFNRQLLDKELARIPQPLHSCLMM